MAKVTIDNRIVIGACVINDEAVDYGERRQRYVSIYEVTDGLITAVRFVR